MEIPITVNEDLIPFLKLEPLWAKGVERQHNLHSLVNVMLIKSPQDSGGLLEGILASAAKPRFLVVAATRSTKPCDCRLEGCQQIDGNKVTYSMMYRDLMQACRDAETEFLRLNPPLTHQP